MNSRSKFYNKSKKQRPTTIFHY